MRHLFFADTSRFLNKASNEGYRLVNIMLDKEVIVYRVPHNSAYSNRGNLLYSLIFVLIDIEHYLLLKFRILLLHK